MASNRSAAKARRWLFAALCGLTAFAPGVMGQEERELAMDAIRPTSEYRIQATQQDLSMVVNSSRMLTLDEDVKYFTVHNPEVIVAQPIASKRIQISAKKTGVTQVDLVTGDDKTYSLQVMVLGDARELEIILRQQFPTSQLKVTPVQTGCIVSGVVTNSDDVETAISIAELYFPKVINGIQVIGVHQVLLHTQVMEVSRTKLRELGVDWSVANGGDVVNQSVSGLIGAGSTSAGIVNNGQNTVQFGVVGNGNAFFGLIRALRQNNLIKVLADPTVVAVDGRPASFNSGGEFPILIPQGLGQVAVEFREFGTRLDFVAKVRDNSRIWLEVRPTISEIDPSRSVTINGTQIPGLRSRFVDTAVELNAGQTLAIAGLLQVRTETENAGLPFLADLPYLGVPFRRTREIQNEVELLITVTPEFAEAMDPIDVPPMVPGVNSCSPSDKEFYMRGYMEVPNTGDPTCQPGRNCPEEVVAPQGHHGAPGHYGTPGTVIDSGMLPSPAQPMSPMSPMPVPDASARVLPDGRIIGVGANGGAVHSDRTANATFAAPPQLPRR